MPGRVEEVLPLGPDGTFQCSITGNIFRKGEWATPALPRFPMGFSHSVEIAAALAVAILAKAVPQEAVSLNVKKDAVVPESKIGLYYGSYIDNLFLFCSNLKLAERTHARFDEEIEKSGLVLSESDPPKRSRKLLGFRAEGDGEHPGLRPLEGLEDEMVTMSTKSFTTFRQLEGNLGKASWAASTDYTCFQFFRNHTE